MSTTVETLVPSLAVSKRPCRGRAKPAFTVRFFSDVGGPVASVYLCRDCMEVTTREAKAAGLGATAEGIYREER